MKLEALKEIRVKRKIKLQDMVKTSGLSRRSIQRIEAGEKTVLFSSVEAYLSALGGLRLAIAIE